MKKVFCLSLVAAITLSGMAEAATSPKCPGEEGYNYINYRSRNPQAGGFVSNLADVLDSDNVFIAPTAAVCGSSSVRDSARIYGNAVIENSEVYGNARVYGNAKVSKNSEIYGDARVFDDSKVVQSRIYGDATIEGWFKAINTTISTGRNTAPQYTQAELDEMEARKRAEEERRAAEQRAEEERKIAEQKRLERILNLRDQLASIFNNNKIETDSKTYTETPTVLKKLGSYPCYIGFIGDFWGVDFTKDIKIVNGVDLKGANNFRSNYFAPEYFANNPNPSKYHYNYVLNNGARASMTAVPLVIVSTVEVKPIGYVEKIGEYAYETAREEDIDFKKFYFPKAETREEFLRVITDLSNNCLGK